MDESNAWDISKIQNNHESTYNAFTSKKKVTIFTRKWAL